MPIFLNKRIIKLGVKSLWLHRLRSLLTALGIIFGVCSVIAMLAIGEGASYEAQERIKRLGSQNVLIRSVKPPEEESATQERSRVSEYGLTYLDAERMAATLPTITRMATVRELRKDVWFQDRRRDAPILGTGPELQKTASLEIVPGGRFLNAVDLDENRGVCVLGTGLARTLFPLEDPLEETVKVGTVPFSVVGVLQSEGGDAASDDDERSSAFGDMDNSIFIPLSTARARFGELTIRNTSGSFLRERVPLHRIILEVKNDYQVVDTAESAKELLKRYHTKNDYKVVVPQKLLKEAEKTKRMFNIVLGSIAAISLLVGGIGIMNIMLASVTERTREIGVRRALGARRGDIMTQFLAETVLLSAFGGLIGVVVGILIPFVVTRFTDMNTIVTPWSLGLAFTISALVGVVFGLYPARAAALMDPIEALRHE